MTPYYVGVNDELATRLKETDDELITGVLKTLVEKQSPSADEADYEE